MRPRVGKDSSSKSSKTQRLHQIFKGLSTKAYRTKGTRKGSAGTSRKEKLSKKMGESTGGRGGINARVKKRVSTDAKSSPGKTEKRVFQGEGGT